MRRILLYVLLILAVTGTIFTIGCQQNYQHPVQVGYTIGEFRQATLDEHNKIRIARNIGSLSVDSRLQEAAQRHADWMAEHEKLTHTANGRTVADRVAVVGFSYRTLGENIAYGYHTPHQVMQGWLDSYGHRKNIVNDGFRLIGIGISISKDGTIYWCVVFGG